MNFHPCPIAPLLAVAAVVCALVGVETRDGRLRAACVVGVALNVGIALFGGA